MALKEIRDSMTKEIDAIERAIALLRVQGGWCQGAEARAADGRPVHPTRKDAVAFSLSGAVYRTVFDGDWDLALYQRAVGLLGTLPSKNDAPAMTLEDLVGPAELLVQEYRNRGAGEAEAAIMIATLLEGSIAPSEDFRTANYAGPLSSFYILQNKPNGRTFRIDVTEVDVAK